MSDEWFEQAECKKAPDKSIFFPESHNASRLLPVAVSYCNACTVREQCLDFALENHIKEGIYGGLSGRQRRKAQADRKRRIAKSQTREMMTNA